MPQVSISWSRNAGDSNYLYGMPGGTIGPNSGSRTVNVGWNQTYNLSANGSGPGNVAMRRLNNNTLGLDDRQGAGADGDYNDMIIYVNNGGFINNSQYRSPTPVYGCTNSAAINYNPSAQVDDGSCVVVNPTLYLTSSNNPLIRGQSTNISWSTSYGQYMQSATVTGIGNVNTSGSSSIQPQSSGTYTFTVSWNGGSRSTSLQQTVYIPPQITAYFDTNTIVLGGNTRLWWSTSGDASTMTISPSIGATLLSSNAIVQPTLTTTYTLTANGVAGSTSEQLTLTVIQPPSLEVSGPIVVPYGQETINFSYEVTNANSVDVEVIQRDLDNSDTTYNFTTSTDASLYEYTPVWGNRGPMAIIVTMTANGQGGLIRIRQVTVPVSIDQTPDAIDIPSIEDKLRDEQPVITPDVEVTSEQIVVDDIDIPVEVKSNFPVQVEIDNSNVWYNIREL
jgi:hypothetical protein|tara:strand:+ start:370 stop:1716 length:1347 start_codon:yes stop_codon:yes gene_type:complete